MQPSEELEERLGLEDLEEEPDISIHNCFDLQGIRLTGSNNNIEALSTILRKELFDVVLRRNAWASCLDIEFPWGL